jgi:hypothetical protein
MCVAGALMTNDGALAGGLSSFVMESLLRRDRRRG